MFRGAEGLVSLAPAGVLPVAPGGGLLGLNNASTLPLPDLPDSTRETPVVMSTITNLFSGAPRAWFPWLRRACFRWRRKHRSEEHTSELQSHSFISYAVFCFK